MFQAMTLRRTFMVVPASPVGPSSRRRCRSRGGVGSGRCGEAEHLGDAVAREIRVFSYDVLVRHALGQARQDERRREACSPDPLRSPSRPKYTCLVLRFPEHALHDRPLPLHSLDCGTTLLTTSSRSPSTGTPSTSWASRTLATSTPSRRSVLPLVRPRPGCAHGLLRS